MSTPGPIRPADMDRHGETPANGDLAELRDLLLGPERALIVQLQERLRSRPQRTADVGDVLPDAILLRAKSDPQLRQALQPMLEEALRISVRKDPEILAEALFPVIGRAVRRAVATALQGMVESLNQIIETSFSLRSIAWRVEAARTGKSYGEIALLRSLLYRVEQVFLIQNDTGLLLQHVISDSAIVRDPDMISGMLTAIQNFVQDSFGAAGSALENVRLGEFTVCIQQGPQASLAAVVHGTPPPAIGTVFSSALESVHCDCAKQLASFNGDATTLDVARPVLQRCLLGQSPPDRRRSMWPLYILAGILTIAIAVWAAVAIRESRRWHSYLDALRREPGIVITNENRRWMWFTIDGMRDPLARDPAELLTRSGIPASRVTSHWVPYLSLAPELVGLRELPRLRAALEQQAIYFDTGRSTLTPAALDAVGTVSAVIRQIRSVATGSARRYGVAIIGHTDDEGSPEKNLELGMERALAVKTALSGLGVDGISVRSAGSAEPLLPAESGRRQPRNRSVTFRVMEPAK